MAERATVQQQSQIGVEVTEGTNVVCPHILPATSITPHIATDMTTFRQVGQKYPTVVALNKEWVECNIAGQLAYADLTFLLAGILCDPTTAVYDTNGFTHTFHLNPAAVDAIKTYSVEIGDPGTYAAALLASEFSNGLITSLGMEFSRSGCNLTGTMLGKAYTDLAATMTAGTALASVPVQPTEVDVYMDTSLGGIGGTKLTRCLNATLTLNNRFNPLWVLNQAVSGFVAHVELAPDYTVSLKVEADATGMGPLALLRLGSTRWFRIKCTSATVAGATLPYDLTIDFAGKFNAMAPFADEEGVYAIEYTAVCTPELTTSYPLLVVLHNKVADVV
jgi:hypothetical protein